MVDFSEVKKQFPVEKVLELLGIEAQKQRNGQYRCACPIHHGTDPRGFVVTPAKGLWYCFGGCGGGDQIALVAKLKEITAKEAAEWLDVGGTVTRTESEPKAEQFQELGYLQAEHESVEAVGFEPEVAKALGIGYAPKGTLKGTVAIPIRLPDGSLAGYIGIIEATLPQRWHLPTAKILPMRKRKAR